MNQFPNFERNILKKIYRPIQDRGEWYLRYNKELHHVYEVQDIVTDIKVTKQKWVGHVKQMKSNKMSKRIMENTPIRRKFGKQRSR